MNISIIIPNYNGAGLLKKNLPKVFEAAEYYLEYKTSEIEIIIVDDCSEDNSIEEIKNYLSKIMKIVPNFLGFFVGYVGVV